MENKKRKRYNTFTDYLKVVTSGLVFVIVIVLGIWTTTLTIEPDPNFNPDAFWGEFFKRALLTILLVSSGISFAYEMTKLIIVSRGAKSYESNTGVYTTGYRYIAAQNGIINAKRIIDKHGLIMELEESIDFVNYERRLDAYEDAIDRDIVRRGKELQKRKVARDPELSKQKRMELLEIKTRKSIIAKYRTAITKFNREDCLLYDEQLYELYGEPKYEIVYSKDIYHMKHLNKNIFEVISNSAPMLFFKERVKPVLSPLLFVFLTTYYIVTFMASPNSIVLLLTVGTTTIMAMLNAVIREITYRFNRLYTEPLEDNYYVFKKFEAKNKLLIDVLEKGELTIEEYRELQKHKLEMLKIEMEKQKMAAIKKEVENVMTDTKQILDIKEEELEEKT